MFAQTSPENAAIIDRLISALSTTSMGSTILYPTLREAAPGWHESKNFWLLTTAKERAEKDLGCVFATVRGVGVKRLKSSEIPDVGLAALGHIRRHARHQKKRLDRVNTNSLSTGEQRRVIGMSAMLGAVAVVAEGRKATAIGAVADPAKPIPPQNILEMFQPTAKT